jgi:hypothetical protein
MNGQSYEEYLAVKGDARRLKKWSDTINIYEMPQKM